MYVCRDNTGALLISDGFEGQHKFNYDIIVIGRGDAVALSCAKEARSLGAKVAVIDYSDTIKQTGSAHIHTHIYTYTYTHTHVHTLNIKSREVFHRSACAHTHTLRALVCVTIYNTYYTYIHACMHTYIHTYIYTYIHTYIKKDNCIKCPVTVPK